MPEIRRRVYLQEVITHSFIIVEPDNDEEAIADAAEQMFVQGHTPDHEEAITDRRFLYSEVING